MQPQYLDQQFNNKNINQQIKHKILPQKDIINILTSISQTLFQMQANNIIYHGFYISNNSNISVSSIFNMMENIILYQNNTIKLIPNQLLSFNHNNYDHKNKFYPIPNQKYQDQTMQSINNIYNLALIILNSCYLTLTHTIKSQQQLQKQNNSHITNKKQLKIISKYYPKKFITILQKMLNKQYNIREFNVWIKQYLKQTKQVKYQKKQNINNMICKNNQKLSLQKNYQINQNNNKQKKSLSKSIDKFKKISKNENNQVYFKKQSKNQQPKTKQKSQYKRQQKSKSKQRKQNIKSFQKFKDYQPRRQIIQNQRYYALRERISKSPFKNYRQNKKKENIQQEQQKNDINKQNNQNYEQNNKNRTQKKYNYRNRSKNQKSQQKNYNNTQRVTNINRNVFKNEQNNMLNNNQNNKIDHKTNEVYFKRQHLLPEKQDTSRSPHSNRSTKYSYLDHSTQMYLQQAQKRNNIIQGCFNLDSQRQGIKSIKKQYSNNNNYNQLYPNNRKIKRVQYQLQTRLNVNKELYKNQKISQTYKRQNNGGYSGSYYINNVNNENITSNSNYNINLNKYNYDCDFKMNFNQQLKRQKQVQHDILSQTSYKLKKQYFYDKTQRNTDDYKDKYRLKSTRRQSKYKNNINQKESNNVGNIEKDEKVENKMSLNDYYQNQNRNTLKRDRSCSLLNKLNNINQNINLNQKQCYQKHLIQLPQEQQLITSHSRVNHQIQQQKQMKALQNNEKYHKNNLQKQTIIDCSPNFKYTDLYQNRNKQQKYIQFYHQFQQQSQDFINNMRQNHHQLYFHSQSQSLIDINQNSNNHIMQQINNRINNNQNQPKDSISKIKQEIARSKSLINGIKQNRKKQTLIKNHHQKSKQNFHDQYDHLIQHKKF